MNPNPRSDTIFFTVPFGIARSPPLELRIERIGLVRERRMPAAREIARRPGERPYFTILVRKGGSGEEPSTALGGEAKAEADQDEAGGRLEGLADPVAAEEVADSGDNDRVEG